MTKGHVIGLQAKVVIPFRLPDKPDVGIEFVVDTGFEGALTLPPAAVEALALPYFEPTNAILADNTAVRIDGYVASIVWDRVNMDVLVLAMGKRPLLGTALLAGKELVAQFVDDGIVTVDDL